jgi:hypothetical protein
MGLCASSSSPSPHVSVTPIVPGDRVLPQVDAPSSPSAVVSPPPPPVSSSQTIPSPSLLLPGSVNSSRAADTTPPPYASASADTRRLQQDLAETRSRLAKSSIENEELRDRLAAATRIKRSTTSADGDVSSDAMRAIAPLPRASAPKDHSLAALSGAPLLFGDKRRLPKEMAKTHYPMLVMKVSTVLRLTQLLPHQEMLEQKLLLPYNPLTMTGRVIFVSHQVIKGARGEGGGGGGRARGRNSRVGWGFLVPKQYMKHHYHSYYSSFCHPVDRAHARGRDRVTAPNTTADPGALKERAG